VKPISISSNLNSQFFKEKLEKLNLMLITAKKLEGHIDEARRVLLKPQRSLHKEL
jgi:hypothetical protein